MDHEVKPRPAAARGEVTVLVALLLALVGSALLLAEPIRPPWRWPFPPERERVAVTVGDVTVKAELARTLEEQQLGLGYRDALQPGTGMLFVYDEPGFRTFWMKGMRFCLDIVWIEGGQVVGAAERVCPSPPGTPDEDLPRFRSPRPVRYVLEVPAGWLDAHDLGPGAPVDLPLPTGTPTAA